MRRLGLIGGTSWHSTIEYYRDINKATNEHFGNNTNPPLVLVNLDQAQVHKFQVEDRWEDIAAMFTKAAGQLVAAGVDAVMFCANTPHRIYPQVESAITVPILHIADATAQAIKRKNLDVVGFIGTRYSMEQSFVTDRIGQQGIRVLTPETSKERVELHRIIQQELTFGRIEESSKQFVRNSIDTMTQKGGQGIVLGCTEFPLMFGDGELEIPDFNTTSIHAQAAVEFILNR